MVWENVCLLFLLRPDLFSPMCMARQASFIHSVPPLGLTVPSPAFDLYHRCLTSYPFISGLTDILGGYSVTITFQLFFLPRPAILLFSRVRPFCSSLNIFILYCQPQLVSGKCLPLVFLLRPAHSPFFLPGLTSYFVAKFVDSFYSRCKLHTARQAAIIFHTTLVAHCISQTFNLYHNFITSRHSFLN